MEIKPQTDHVCTWLHSVSGHDAKVWQGPRQPIVATECYAAHTSWWWRWTADWGRPYEQAPLLGKRSCTGEPAPWTCIHMTNQYSLKNWFKSSSWSASFLTREVWFNRCVENWRVKSEDLKQKLLTVDSNHIAIHKVLCKGYGLIQPYQHLKGETASDNDEDAHLICFNCKPFTAH